MNKAMNDKSNNNAHSPLRERAWVRMLFLAAVMTLASCENQTTQDNAQRERDSLMAVIAGKDAELNDFMAVFTDIQSSLQQMSAAEGRVTVAENDPERVNKSEQIREDLRFLNEAAQQQRERIAQLEEKLKASSLGVDKMKKAILILKEQLDEQTARVQELQVRLAEQDELIARQGETIAEQDRAITELGAENERRAQEVSAQDKQLNEAWYVFGTKSELKAQKIIDSGEVLTTDRFNRDYFTQIDIRNTKEIKLYSRNAKLLTSHPQGSYTLAKDGKDEFVLTVTNVQKFWSLSRYLVIQVK